MVDVDGQVHDAASRLDAGDHLLLVFWQTWCRQCGGQMPLVAKAQKRFGERIAVYGVISGPDGPVDDAEVRAKISALGLTGFPQVRDRMLWLTRLFGVSYVPTVLVVTPEGIVSYRSQYVPTEEEWAGLLAAR